MIVMVQVDQTDHEFGFGTAIKAALFSRTDPINTNYKNFVYDNFNWVVFENDMKWKLMEPWKVRNIPRTVDQLMDYVLRDVSDVVYI